MAVFMAGIITICSLLVTVTVLVTDGITLYSSLQLGASLGVGLSGLASGTVGDAGVQGTAQQPQLSLGMILILNFVEMLGLYSLIMALSLSTK